jgi:glycosyltransferase involved in cell wall biosynthesis
LCALRRLRSADDHALPAEGLAVTNVLMKPDPMSCQSSPRLRVLTFTIVFPSPGSPLNGTFVFERIRHLAELADIHVVAPVRWYRMLSRRQQLPHPAPILSVKHPPFWYTPKMLMALHGFFLFLSTVRQIARMRKTFDFDLIDAHFAYPDGFAAILLGKWFRRPVCITLRGMIIPLSRRALGRCLCNWAIRRAERVIAVAENLAERARQGGVPEDRLALIANGVDSERFRAIDQIAARRQLGLPEGGRLLVTVGHMSWRRGFHRVIRNLPRVIRSCPDTRLVIVGGKGAEEDNSADLRSLAKRLDLSDHVQFVGAQSPDQVAVWMAAANVFVLATDFEGCPNVILEAMSCGRPVVATTAGDIARMVPPFAGILFEDPEDDAALAQSMVAALTRDWDADQIRNHVATRSWDDVARRVVPQWRLAVDAFKARNAQSAPPSTGDLVTAVIKGREA